MDTNPVGNNFSLPAKQTRVPKKVLDQTDFLNLLVSQLKNQDPLDPQSNEEFMSTMAQFNSLETLVSLDKSVQYGQAVAMIDRPVTVQKPNREPVSGRVEKAGIVNGKAVLYVGGEEYGLNEVKEVLYQDPNLNPATGSDLIQAALMIGKEVLIAGGDGQVRGTVEKVGLDKGLVQVFVNGVPYGIGGIVEIGGAGSPRAAGDMPDQEESGVVDGEGTP
ncbi:MAG: hypothetical protein K6T66_09740 [Peptococcaceae bacterium]|nr:hypothetical protein [Peptococcaceae bacterium]